MTEPAWKNRSSTRAELASLVGPMNFSSRQACSTRLDAAQPLQYPAPIGRVQWVDVPQPAEWDFGELVRWCHDCPDSFSVLGDNGIENLKDCGVLQMKCDRKRTPLADRYAAAASTGWVGSADGGYRWWGGGIFARDGVAGLFGWDGVEGAAEVAFAEADVGVGVVGDFDAEGVHAGGG